MKNKNRLNAMLIIVLAGLLVTGGCTSSRQKPEQAAEQATETAGNDSIASVSLTPAQYANAGIQLGNMTQRRLNGSLQVNGMVDVPPQSEISVTFPYGGFVRKINVLDGDYVKKGSLLAILENPEFVDLQENYLKNKSALQYARQEYARQKELYQADVAAGKSFQKAQSEFESLNATVNALAQKLNMLGIRADDLTANNIRSKVNIVAPDNGYVTRISANLGKYINAQEELLQIDNTQDVHIDLTVYEKDINAVKKGQEVRFTISGSNQPEQKARVILIGRAIGPDRAVTVHTIPENKNRHLLPGAYVQAFIDQAGTRSDVLPEEAVVRSEGKRYIFVKDKNQPHSFQMIPVQVIAENNGYLQVKLSENRQLPDSSVVTKGAFSLLSALKNTGEED